MNLVLSGRIGWVNELGEREDETKRTTGENKTSKIEQEGQKDSDRRKNGRRLDDDKDDDDDGSDDDVESDWLFLSSCLSWSFSLKLTEWE